MASWRETRPACPPHVSSRDPRPLDDRAWLDIERAAKVVKATSVSIVIHGVVVRPSSSASKQQPRTSTRRPTASGPTSSPSPSSHNARHRRSAVRLQVFQQSKRAAPQATVAPNMAPATPAPPAPRRPHSEATPAAAPSPARTGSTKRPAVTPPAQPRKSQCTSHPAPAAAAPSAAAVFATATSAASPTRRARRTPYARPAADRPPSDRQAPPSPPHTTASCRLVVYRAESDLIVGREWRRRPPSASSARPLGVWPCTLSTSCPERRMMGFAGGPAFGFRPAQLLLIPRHASLLPPDPDSVRQRPHPRYKKSDT